MRKLLLMLAVLLALPLIAAAEVTFAPDLTDAYIWPEGASETEARYVYRACYPQLGGEGDVVELFNNAYIYLLQDAFGFECPMNATSLPEGSPQMAVDIVYEVTYQDANYLSVKIVKTVTCGEEVSTIISGHVFALTGEQAGLVTSLPYLLGILDPNTMDEWYLNRQIEKADSCARDLVWEMLEDGDVPLYSDMTPEEFEWCFFPEEDFYLDEQGNLVFFLQQGLVAEPEYGVLLCPIELETLLDEI